MTVEETTFDNQWYKDISKYFNNFSLEISLSDSVKDDTIETEQQQKMHKNLIHIKNIFLLLSIIIIIIH